MAIPRTRTEFIDYCLRKLGAPVLKINVAQEQVEDRVDEALQWFQTFCQAGTEHTLYSHNLTQEDVSRGYVVIPDEVLYVVSCFPLDGGNVNTSSNMTLAGIGWSSLYTFPGISSAVGFDAGYREIIQSYSALLSKFNTASLNPPIRFSQHTNRVWIDANWANDLAYNRTVNGSQVLASSQFIMLDCYKIVNPNEYTKVWNDEFLKRYATALIKKQWGENLKKFNGGMMPGGLQFTGQQLYDEADAELEKLNGEIIDGKESMPAYWFIG